MLNAEECSFPLFRIGLLHYQDIRLKGRFSVPAEEYQLLQSKGDQRVIQRLFRDSRMAACGNSSSVVSRPVSRRTALWREIERFGEALSILHTLTSAPLASSSRAMALAHSMFERLSRPLLLDGIKPQTHSKVFALGIAELPAQFLLISVSQYF
jgi:hypothetical protein